MAGHSSYDILQQHSAWCNSLNSFIDAKMCKLFKYICTIFSPVRKGATSYTSRGALFVFQLYLHYLLHLYLYLLCDGGFCGASVAVCSSRGSCPPLALGRRSSYQPTRRAGICQKSAKIFWLKQVQVLWTQCQNFMCFDICIYWAACPLMASYVGICMAENIYCSLTGVSDL